MKFIKWLFRVGEEKEKEIESIGWIYFDDGDRRLVINSASTNCSEADKKISESIAILCSAGYKVKKKSD